MYFVLIRLVAFLLYSELTVVRGDTDGGKFGVFYFANSHTTNSYPNFLLFVNHSKYDTRQKI